SLYPQAKVFYNTNATKEVFFDESQNANVIHYAGHYLPSSSSQKFSKFILANGEITLNEVLRNKFSQAKVVILSACQTNIEKSYRGEGGIGVARAFLASGSPIVIAGNWKIESDSTADLMINFHKFRKEKNISTVEALQKTQIEMLNKKETENPYYWSSFSVNGGFSRF
ncbi:MAG: CHAT domain-containing protein, partial [Pyrinomonadaceae bacterium]|nr:CHAT domain-containing protein [Pyrinomonadaceae bacterium]